VRTTPDAWYADPARARALWALLDDGFPGLAAKAAVAADRGDRWDLVTEPFVVEDERGPVAHVGVIAHPVRLAGRDTVVAGLHAVCTRSDARGRGHAREALRRALAWVDARYGTSKLGTDLPAVYAPHGFRPLALHHFVVDHAGGDGSARPLRPDEGAALRDRCARRDPVSHAFASRDPGWLAGIDLALQRRTLADLRAIDGLGAVVDAEVAADGVLDLHDVIAEHLPPLPEVLRRMPPHRGVRLWVCPDRLAPGARPVPMPEAGVWMVRGDWPLPDAVPFAVGRLAEH
jgi:hypothetical protein